MESIDCRASRGRSSMEKRERGTGEARVHRVWGVNLLVKNFNNFAFEPVLNTTNFEYCNGKRNKIGQTVLVHVRAMDDDVGYGIGSARSVLSSHMRPHHRGSPLPIRTAQLSSVESRQYCGE